jgi:hypothetical protein
VQQELRLDGVKPLRNDLSEADLEVIPARRMAVQRVTSDRVSQPAAIPGDVGAGSGVVWNRLTAKLFTAGRSSFE